MTAATTTPIRCRPREQRGDAARALSRVRDRGRRRRAFLLFGDYVPAPQHGLLSILLGIPLMARSRSCSSRVSG